MQLILSQDEINYVMWNFVYYLYHVNLKIQKLKYEVISGINITHFFFVVILFIIMYDAFFCYVNENVDLSYILLRLFNIYIYYNKRWYLFTINYSFEKISNQALNNK